MLFRKLRQHADIALEEHLDVRDAVFQHRDALNADAEGNQTKEIELTSALEAVRQKSGMMGVRLKGTMYDMGNPNALRNCVRYFSK